MVDDRVAADVAGVQRLVLLETIRGELLGALHVGAVGSWRFVEQCEATHECDDWHGDHGLGRGDRDGASSERQRFSKRGPGWFVGGCGVASLYHVLWHAHTLQVQQQHPGVSSIFEMF